jgi:hypothetical protein
MSMSIVRVLSLNRLELFWLKLDILALGKFVTASLLVLVNDPARALVHHLLAQSVAGLAVDLVEVDFLALGRGGVEDHGAGNEGELEIALPIRTTRRHGSALS